MENFAELVFAQIGVRLTRSQLGAFTRYERELVDWNTRHNLTAIRRSEEIWIKHFLDSLTCLLAMRQALPGRIVDVGAGAGFPGLALKIACPAIQLTLVESVGKKAAFCQHIVDTLALDNVLVLQERAESIGQDPRHREQYDWAVGRAVGGMAVLVEYLLPLVKVGGGILAMKGESGPAEAHGAEKAIHLLGGHLRQLMPVTLPGVAEERFLILVNKEATTPPGYPRRVGVPAKRPLK